MNEPGGKPSNKAPQHSIPASNRQIRDLHQSFQHLHLKNPPNNAYENQSQTAFERQLGLQNNLSALSEAPPGDRRSYPRVAPTAKTAFALENIRRDLKGFPTSTHATMDYRQNSSDSDSSKSEFKSHSFTDIPNMHHNHYLDWHPKPKPNEQQQKLDILLSYGVDEMMAVDTILSYPNQPLEDLIENLKRKITKVSAVNANNNPHRLTQTQKMFGVSSQYAPRGQNMPNGSTRHIPPLVGNQHAMRFSYEPQSSRSSNTNDNTGYTPIYNERPVSGSFISESLNPEPMMMDLDGGNFSSRPYDYKQPHETVVMRPPKHHLAASNQQHRWSAEVIHKQQDDSTSNKRNSMEIYSHKPPPPYPGSKHSLSRISSQEGEFKTVKNTPITVIFDEKNECVNVVGGIPEGYKPAVQSLPVSSGQSSPPPYNYMTQVNQPKQFSVKSNCTVQQPKANKKNSTQPLLSTSLPKQHSSAGVALPGVYKGKTVSTISYAIPGAAKGKSISEKFIPISESGRSDRGSPPPYPGAVQSPSSQPSLNVDDLENDLGYFSTHSSNSPAPPPLTTSTSRDGESKSSTSPVPDDVERSYSPLPLPLTLTINSNYDKTMIIHPKNKTGFEQANSAEREAFSTRLKNYTPQAYKFYMEQHVENLFKQQEQRKIRRQQLEAEMSRVGLPIQEQEQMRKLLGQKESNYIRLRRAKMDKSMFTKIKVVGVGAFGEVSLVRKKETNAYYAMKTLRKSEVLRRNQVAHVKAERDILAEADNEWVVKLYYSFQNQQNLYFVMDYIPGGDLMALLIKFGIFEESLAKFYISELVLAIESVHKLGFIHRDIKPDNILIDKNGHIKLTDFGLCTGFRWTHDSKYYQPEPEGGGHTRQYSMEPEGGWESLMDETNCSCKSHRLQYDLLKPLQRRKQRRHMRCQAHSLVGTPNYIAPEVLMRIPYSQQCDWWSVGVIMYEMLIGRPPFLAQSPAETQFKVINWKQVLTIPKNQLEYEAQDLIRKLCSDPNERIGKDGTDEIKRHSYFSGVDFQRLHQEKAPHVPIIRNPTDTSNFDPVPEDAIMESDSEEHGEQKNTHTRKEGGGGPEYAFYEFTFRHFFDDGGLVNPNTDFDVAECKDDEEEPFNNPTPTVNSKQQANKRAAAQSNSVTVPPKVPATSGSTSEEKTPIYV